MKRLLLGLMMLGMMCLLGGCGSSSLLDTYSFGHQVMHAGQSEITVLLPYEAAQSNVVTSEDGYPMVRYDTGTPNLYVSVRGEESTPDHPLPSIQTYSNNSQQNLLAAGWVGSDLKQTNVTIDGVPAIKLAGTGTYNGRQNGFCQYVFMNKGVLWNISYQFNPESQDGRELASYIEGKIQITKKEG